MNRLILDKLAAGQRAKEGEANYRMIDRLGVIICGQCKTPWHPEIQESCPYCAGFQAGYQDGYSMRFQDECMENLEHEERDYD